MSIFAAAARFFKPSFVKGADDTAIQRVAASGWITCKQGHRHWGEDGAAGLLLLNRGEDGLHVLMQQRGGLADHGGTWSVPGGARDYFVAGDGERRLGAESAEAGALRETREESDLDVGAIRTHDVYSDDHGGWTFDTVIASIPDRVEVHSDPSEVLHTRWVPLERVEQLPLHPGFARTWPAVRARAEEAMRTVE
ncbi:NUDIX hydrolase [Actinoallomurus sp. NBC_01490]|uniref:NUDIX hydrolase n=1 Tax=Actinoallomurus sp. NBC_01490 TaxID=2903557 RepID=UPI002E2F1073|nr:NUDIX hydrolase [Actinoallomurus sp. NBC_01490]